MLLGLLIGLLPVLLLALLLGLLLGLLVVAGFVYQFGLFGLFDWFVCRFVYRFGYWSVDRFVGLLVGLWIGCSVCWVA